MRPMWFTLHLLVWIALGIYTYLAQRFSFVLLGSYEGGWTAQYSNTEQFLQIDLGNVTMVTMIATQGHSVNAWWVKKYTLDFGNGDGNFTAYNNGQAS